VAIFTRVLQYGYTEARYFVLLISVWLTAVILYFIFFKKATIKFIPISLFVFGVFALIFPYFNAFSVSKRSQEKELIQLLVKNKLQINGTIDFKAPVVDSVNTEIENKLEFLSERLDNEFLKTLVDAKTKKLVDKDKNWYNGLFKNVKFTAVGGDNYMRIYSDTNTYGGVLETTLGKDKIKIKYDYNSKNPTYEIKINEEVKDIMPQIKAFCNNYKSASKDVKVDDLSIIVDFQNYQIKILFDSIDWYRKDQNFNFEGTTYLVKSK
jgi:hypothetical protein